MFVNWQQVRRAAWLHIFRANLCRPDILGVLPPSDLAVVSSILADHIKPLFLSNPHPRINATSGRALPRAQGGPLGAHDFLEGQTWKSHVGVAEILSWCVRHCQVALLALPLLSCITNSPPIRVRTMKDYGICLFLPS